MQPAFDIPWVPMTSIDDPHPSAASMSDLPHLAEALDDDRFRQFLDHVPFAVAVAELGDVERLVYVNIEFERLTGLAGHDLQEVLVGAADRHISLRSDQTCSGADRKRGISWRFRIFDQR